MNHTAKPKQWSREYAEIFQDQSVVDAYHFRPGYTRETFEILTGLLVAGNTKSSTRRRLRHR